VVSAPGREQRLIWSLWLAAGIVFVGGLLPLFFGGTSSRVSNVVIPFTIGAVGLAACALLHDQNRTTVGIVYFVAGLAIVYGLLAMFALPIRLAALGSCPVAPYPCTSGLPRALSDAENNGIGSAAAFGLIGLFVGFFGLFTLYRRPTPPPFTPPVRSIPPMRAPVPKQAAVAAETSSSTPPAPAEQEPEPELPAHEEPLELPPHESESATT
jgi:hypothetical protein